MKLLIVTLLFPLICFSQRVYTFDYLTSYDIYFYNDSTTVKKEVFVLTNSQDNDYYITYSQTDSLNSHFVFKDFNGIYSDAVVRTSDIKNSDKYNLECIVVNPYYNAYKYRVKQYDFSKLKDTIVNGKGYKQYQYKSNKPKREKRQKLATNYYIIDTSTPSHLPFFEFPTAYEDWKLDRNFPNGIIKELYKKNSDGRIIMRRVLTNQTFLKTSLTVPADCDYISHPPGKINVRQVLYEHGSSINNN